MAERKPTHEEIAVMAYHFWQHDDRGSAEANWFLAEQTCIELLNQHGDE